MGFMSYVDYTKWLCLPVDFKCQEPKLVYCVNYLVPLYGAFH